MLHPAVRYGRVEFVKLLLDYGVNISVRRFDGDTALHTAARYEYEDIVKLLVEAGANVTTENYCGQTPLERVGPATHGDRMKSVRVIRHILGGVVFRRDPKFIPSFIRGPALHDAVNSHDKIRVTQILESAPHMIGATDAEGNTVLHIAVLNHDELMVRYLILHANLSIRNRRQMTPLHEAVRAGDIALVKLLLRWSANIEDLGYHKKTPLFYAVEEGDVDMVSLLLKRGANIAAELRDETSPLHAAAFLGHTRVARVLLEHGADVNSEDWRGFTPLVWLREFSDLRGGKKGATYKAMNRLLVEYHWKVIEEKKSLESQERRKRRLKRPKELYAAIPSLLTRPRLPPSLSKFIPSLSRNYRRRRY